jgi:hypothetical protein
MGAIADDGGEPLADGAFVLALGIVDAMKLGDAQAGQIVDMLADMAGTVVQSAFKKGVDVLTGLLGKFLRGRLHLRNQCVGETLRVGHTKDGVVKVYLVVEKTVAFFR